jgi:thioesterase domain-containing protein
MGVEVCPVGEDGIRLRAPLAPNSNHIGTAFGGSLHGLATLACWGLVWLALEAVPDSRIVIQESHMNYLRPVNTDLEAFCPFPATAEMNRFVERMRRRGRARLSLQAAIRNAGRETATFRGRFVALSPHQSQVRQETR